MGIWYNGIQVDRCNLLGNMYKIILESEFSEMMARQTDETLIDLTGLNNQRYSYYQRRNGNHCSYSCCCCPFCMSMRHFLKRVEQMW
jgi:hypothetical protein